MTVAGSEPDSAKGEVKLVDTGGASIRALWTLLIIAVTSSSDVCKERNFLVTIRSRGLS